MTFDEGQCVDHRSGGMASIVVSRERTAAGREHYRLWEIKPNGSRRERWFAGDYLRATVKRGRECDGCGLRAWCCP